MAPIVTSRGGKILIVTAVDGVPVVSATEFPGLTSDALKDLLRHTDPAGQASGWRVDFNRQQTILMPGSTPSAALALSSGRYSRASSTPR